MYTNRTDMKGLIQWTTDDEKIPNDHAEGIEEFSFFSRNVNNMKYKFVSNYVHEGRRQKQIIYWDN